MNLRRLSQLSALALLVALLAGGTFTAVHPASASATVAQGAAGGATTLGDFIWQ
ncbi:hypothetical protein ABZV65_04630 [Streptomyces bauhiniae]|uniref:hypothetical protein n=1 Tax=Streptomyces bauhiniae TaxID=2340725 RepID=UPI0033A47008